MKLRGVGISISQRQLMNLLLKLKVGIRKFLVMSLLIRDVLLLEFCVSRELFLTILILFF